MKYDSNKRYTDVKSSKGEICDRRGKRKNIKSVRGIERTCESVKIYGVSRKMKKEDFIAKCGKGAYKRWLQQGRDWKREHPNQVKASSQERSRESGKYYERTRRHQSKGIPHAWHLIRMEYGRRYRPYKQIIAPESQIHHEWLPKTCSYRGVALVEKDQHMHGFIDVIHILEGEITVLTEAEILKEEK